MCCFGNYGGNNYGCRNGCYNGCYNGCNNYGYNGFGGFQNFDQDRCCRNRCGGYCNGCGCRNEYDRDYNDFETFERIERYERRNEDHSHFDRANGLNGCR